LGPELHSFHTLSGSGTAELHFRLLDPPVEHFWWFESAHYTFVDPLAVPEPSTLLLLGGALLVGAQRLRHRSTQS
jgi:hypothetical protein